MSNDIIGNSNERLVSQQVFEKLKAYCIQLSQEVLQPQLNETKTISLLNLVVNLLHSEYKRFTDDGIFFKLLPNVADYIFFPISNLLKQPRLNDKIIQHILSIIGFLIQHCWRFQINTTLIDQLFPLVLFLSGVDTSKTEGNNHPKSLQFQNSAIYVSSQLIDALDKTYFEAQEKRLHFLSSTITFALSVITSNKSNDQESIEVLSNAFQLVKNSLLRLNKEQISMILPGIVSALTNFTSSNSNINYQLLIQILRLLTFIVTSSFNDTDLQSELVIPEVESLSDIEVAWDDDEKTLDETPTSIDDIRITEKDHRTMPWLKATSKQLKITLVTLFKSILLSSRNRQRWQSKSELYDVVVKFVTSILKNCFITLYNELTPLTLDICSILLFSSTYDDKLDLKVWELASTVEDAIDDSTSKLTAYFNIVKMKLSSLISSKLSVIVFSTDEDKISMNIIAIKFHFAVLMEISRKLGPELNELIILKQRCLSLLIEITIDHVKFISSNKSIKKSDNVLNTLTPGTSNTLDSIELPGHINASSVKTDKKSQQDTKDHHSNHLQQLSRQWNDGVPQSRGELTVGLGSKFFESKLKSIVLFLSHLELNQAGQSVEELEAILDDFDNDTLSKGVSLWFASTLAQSGLTKTKGFSSNDFLNIDDMEVDDDENEASYLLLMKSQDLISNLNSAEIGSSQVEKNFNQTAIIAALESISTITGTMSLDNFRSNVLMDNLLYIFQALTFTDRPNVQFQAQNTIQNIVDTYYNGSIKELIMDNSDYLVDGVSLQMTVASNLSPMLPGILMVIIKIAGIQLLETNQLTDILSDMFVILDSYHGYNKLVESFFIVFEALTDQIEKLYLSSSNAPKIENQNQNKSQFKPWGMTNKFQLFHFLNDESTIDPLQDFDADKEYFKRPDDKPFSEMNTDSDDEEEDLEDDSRPQEEEEEPWTSPIPKSIYIVLKRIFNYGFVLISQPSYTLKSQIMKTFRLLFPLLCTNYKLVLPMITSNWAMLSALISGVDSLSTTLTSNSYSREKVNLTIETLSFVIQIINQDYVQNEFFFSRKFQDTWDFISNHSSIVDSSTQTQISTPASKDLVIAEKAVYALRMNPNLKEKLVEFLLTGAQVYEKSIPDLTRYSIIQLCYKLKIPQQFPKSRDTLCILEVLQTNLVH
ncbi:hypothetical protein KGF54_001289 [Candida jiufengensis]|uniref:uncharacterized protein n=1 Tax=Candida jiufengensis TaxID=497108 RepID=UPI00222546DD|nr:uncharacterized protein KGF54_001289 [Candida jiufengensis]KAI5955787.1 hypothetical protein KGF54_001289 [Candida jiufengensis]